jgi:predicted dehydrogenase
VDSIGVGIVGCGFVGRGAHVPAFAKTEGSKLVAIADPDEGRRANVTKKYQTKTYSDYNDLVNDPEISLVVVSVPTPLHGPVAMAAIQAGKHVLCEMPLARTLDEANQIIEAAEKQGVVLMPSLTFRFTPTFVRIKELIAQGKLGEPTAAIYREFIPARDLAMQWPAGGWMWDLEKSGGPLFTLAVWSIDLARWLFEAEIDSVGAAVKYVTLEQFGGTMGYDSSATLGMSNGTVVSLQYSGTTNRSGSSNTLEVVGSSTAVVKANGNETVTLFGDDPVKTEWNVKEPGARMWGHVQQDEHLIRCLQSGKQPSITPDDGRIAMEVALQVANV